MCHTEVFNRVPSVKRHALTTQRNATRLFPAKVADRFGAMPCAVASRRRIDTDRGKRLKSRREQNLELM